MLSSHSIKLLKKSATTDFSQIAKHIGRWSPKIIQFSEEIVEKLVNKHEK